MQMLWKDPEIHTKYCLFTSDSGVMGEEGLLYFFCLSSNIPRVFYHKDALRRREYSEHASRPLASAQPART